MYSACISVNETRYKKVSDFANKWKELRCAQGDVAVRFPKQNLETVKGAGYHQRCYQRFCDKARDFFLEYETLTWNGLVNLIFVTICYPTTFTTCISLLFSFVFKNGTYLLDMA